MEFRALEFEDVAVYWFRHKVGSTGTNGSSCRVLGSSRQEKFSSQDLWLDISLGSPVLEGSKTYCFFHFKSPPKDLGGQKLLRVCVSRWGSRLMQTSHWIRNRP